ncbi:hypothetical protein B296_00004816 [Ensete ventricosum]|uniref:Uncharacterized protein n=1 Tax=Ensete ventricosum TaxID=4639 RepID=A0A427B200_ENSVE|nr:hypothetical protein B296_00004816 [Ensete ventricosum]
MIGYRSWGRFKPDRKSDFVTELAQESGRLRELSRLGIVAAPSQAGSPGSGLQATPFVGTPSGEPIGELPNCLDLASETEESLDCDDERSRLARDRFGIELEFDRMGRAPGLGLGGRLLVAELRRRGLYSDSNGISVPESLIFFIAYHIAASHHAVRGPCDEARACR